MSTRAIGRDLVVRGLNLASRAWPAKPRLIGRERILVIRPDHLGDVVLSTAVLRALRQARPAAEITALIGPWAASVLQSNTDIDRVLTFPFPWFDRRSVPPPIERYLVAVRLAGRLRAYSFDQAIILRPDHWWGALVVRMAAIPTRTGYAGSIQNRLLTNPVPPHDSEHAVVSGLRLVDPARQLTPAFQCGLPLTILQSTCADRAIADSLLPGTRGKRAKRLAIIHPGASVAPKRWPNERWATIANRFAENGWTVAIAVGPGEGEIADEMCRTSVSSIVHLGEVSSMGTLAALFARADLALGMDSAPMHVATAVGTPTIRLFGPGNERLFGPWGDPQIHRIVRAPGTAPDDAWFGRPGTTHPTVDAIDVDMVWQAFSDASPFLA